MSFEVYISSIIWWIFFRQGMRLDTLKLKAFTNSVKKGITSIPLYIKLFKQVFCSYSWGMLATIKNIGQDKIHHKRGCLHEIQWRNKTSVLRNRCIWIRIGSWITANQRQNELSTRWSTSQQHPKTKCIHQQKPIKCGKRYSNVEKEALGMLHGLENFTTITLQERLSSQIISHW